MLEHGKTVEGLTARSQLLEKVNAWAQPGGVLTLNYKPNRRLNVVLVQAPGEGSLREYTKDYALIFRAYAVPYWEDASVTSATIRNGTSGSTQIQIEGSAETQCDVVLENISGMTINTCSITVAGQTMTFSSLGLGGHEALVIDHVDGLVRIRIRSGYRSAMLYRAGANDFKVQPGARTCAFSAQRACRMTVSWRARYL
jgi:filamentous hemagglutinin family protein